MESAVEYQLKLVDWQFFGTVTWSEANLGTCRSRERDLWQFLRDWLCGHNVWGRQYAPVSPLRLAQHPTVVRWERGEEGDRPHGHFLISGLPSKAVNVGMCFYVMKQWEKFGFMRLRLYGNGKQFAIDDAASYVVPPSHNKDANTYELGKFDYADRLCINDAAWRIMLERSGAAYIPQARTA